MNPTDYREACLKTWSAEGRTREQQIENCALGLIREAGEVAELIKKHVYHGKPLDTHALILELGDVLYYTEIARHLCRFSPDIQRSFFKDPEPEDDVQQLGANAIGLAWRASTLAHQMQFGRYAYKQNLIAEIIRTLLFSVARVGQFAGATLEQIRDENVIKLQGRYPQGFVE